MRSKEALQKRIVALHHDWLIGIVVGPHQRITEVPGMFGKQIIVDMETQGTEILDSKDSRSPGVSLPKGVNLPNTRYEP